MKLFHAPRAINPERTFHFLKAKGKLDAVEIEEISIMKMEHKTPEYRALSPYSQVPVLILDDGTKITESRAICTYFEALFPEPNLMGNDAKEKALIEMWDRRIEMMFLVGFATWFRNSSEFMKELENRNFLKPPRRRKRRCGKPSLPSMLTLQTKTGLLLTAIQSLISLCIWCAGLLASPVGSRTKNMSTSARTINALQSGSLSLQRRVRTEQLAKPSSYRAA